MVCVGVESECVIKLTTGHKFGRLHLALSGRMDFWISSPKRQTLIRCFESDSMVLVLVLRVRAPQTLAGSRNIYVEGEEV